MSSLLQTQGWPCASIHATGKIHCADYSSLPLERGDDVLAFLS